MESTNSKTTVLLAADKQWTRREQSNQAVCLDRVHVRDLRERSVIFRDDKRFESDRDAGFGSRKATLSLSFQIQDKRIANPYQLQAELGLTDWGEVAVFRGFQPDEWIFGTEIGLLRKEPYLLSIGFINWSPHLDVDPQPFIEAGYYSEHHKVIAGAIHAGYKNEAILGYAYDFNERWRLQVDWQSGSENSSTIGFTCNVTPDFQFNPALYCNNDPKHDLFGYIVFTYTFHVWGNRNDSAVDVRKSTSRQRCRRKIMSEKPEVSTKSDQRRSAYVSAQE